MYSRLLTTPKEKSFFLFGPRGTGKSTWVKTAFPKAIYLDLLEGGLYTTLLAEPQRLEQMIPKQFSDWIVIDEVQRIPALLSEVHRLIEQSRYKFVLTGSSVRKLRQKGVNLLAGRALTLFLYPLTAREAGQDFDLHQALKVGQLPAVYQETDPKKYLESYVQTYLREEILQEGLTRNLSAFSRFLESASFSQASQLNISAVARDCSIERKVVENYFSILEDLLLGVRIPVFAKKAKRRVSAHPKFYFFDAGVYQTVRPKGPLDSVSEIEGAAVETLIFQELRAVIDYLNLEYKIYYWRTAAGVEVDFVLYGPAGIIAIEVKRKSKVHKEDIRNLEIFRKDYPMAKTLVLYGGDQRMFFGKTEIIPIPDFLLRLPARLL